MQLRIQHLERRQSFGNILCGKLLLTAYSNVCHFGVDRLYHSLESYLLEVENDVLHTLDNAWDRSELLVHSGDLDGADGKAFQ